MINVYRIRLVMINVNVIDNCYIDLNMNQKSKKKIRYHVPIIYCDLDG